MKTYFEYRRKALYVTLSGICSKDSVKKFKKKWFGQTKIDVQSYIENEFERTKNELLKEFEYLKDEKGDLNKYDRFEETK